VVARRGTPDAILNQLHDAVVKAVKSPDVVQRYGDLGLEIAPSSRAEFERLIQTETNRWGAAIRTAGVKLD
jgi:tripartite-type tricarboxylate transporter receptor subunit TctC